MKQGDPIRWPPPGLERVQGDLAVIAARAALTGLLLVLPVLFVVSRVEDRAAFGPFADAWWVLIGLGVGGLAVGLDVFARLARVLNRARLAVQEGYPMPVILRVLADRGRDMGFLTTGARHFSVMDERERDGLALLRIAGWSMVTFGGLWLVVALGAGLLVASRGGVTPRALQLFVLLPASLLYVAGGVALLVQDERVRRARRAWFRQPWAADLTSEETRNWQEEMELVPVPARGAGLRAARWGVGLVAALVILPVLTLLPASAVGPILTAVAIPGLDRYTPRAMEAESYRSYQVEGDPGVSAEEAGRVLHRLLYVGETGTAQFGQREPDRRIEEPWLPVLADGTNPTGLDAFVWPDSLFDAVALGLSPEARDYLAEVASHPANGDFALLARATALDAGAARWALPFADGTTVATIPLPRYGSFRDAARARIAASAFAWSEGRPDEAERTLREVISVGFLLADDGPTLIDNLIGYTLVESGGSALAEFYRHAGRAAAAAELSRLRSVAERTAEMAGTSYPSTGDAWVRALYAMTLDPTLPRGLRWEYFINLSTVAPCLNLNRIVFGVGDEYDAFVEEARAALVRYPSDEALFEIARHGWIGPGAPDGENLLARFLGLYMHTGPNSCRRFMTYMQASGPL